MQQIGAAASQHFEGVLTGLQREPRLRFHRNFEGSFWILGSGPKSTLTDAEIKEFALIVSAPQGRDKDFDFI